MNVLELCLSPSLGGLELYVFRAAKTLSQQFNTKKDENSRPQLDKPSSILAIVTKDSKLDNHFKKNSNIDIQYLNRRSSALPLISAKKLASIIDKNKIDIVHVHWNKDFPLCIFAKLFSKRRPAVVFTRHMMITREKNDIYHNFLHKHMTLMLSISKELECLCKRFIPQYTGKIVNLYHGVKQPDEFLTQARMIEKRKELNFKKNDFIAGIIGRLEENKGQHLLISAASIAKKHGHVINILIVGHEMSAGYRDTLKQQAKDLGIAEQVKFKDFTSQPQQLMQLCDCIVLASSNETFGLVLPEAMRAGVAVIGSNSGGVPEIIKHNETGLLFNTYDEVDLSKQIETLYTTSKIKNKLATQGKNYADQHFNDMLHFQQLEKIFETCITQEQATMGLQA